MDEATAKRLHDAYNFCTDIERRASQLTSSTYLANEDARLIFERLIEKVGEALRAARQSDPQLNELIPDIGDIIRTRNILAHGYDVIDHNLLFSIATDDIPVLRERLRMLLGLGR